MEEQVVEAREALEREFAAERDAVLARIARLGWSELKLGDQKRLLTFNGEFSRAREVVDLDEMRRVLKAFRAWAGQAVATYERRAYRDDLVLPGATLPEGAVVARFRIPSRP